VIPSWLVALTAAAVSAAPGVSPDTAVLAAIASLSEAREERALGPIANAPRLASLAERRARAVAERPPAKRLRGHPPAAETIEAAGLGPVGWARERIFLLRNVPSPGATVARQWRAVAGDDAALWDASPWLGLGAALAEDGTLVVVGLVARPARDGSAPREASPRAFDVAAVEDQVARLVDEARGDAGLAPLARRARLDRVARAHSRDMARRGTLGHRGSDGSDVSGRVRRAGLAVRKVGENVAFTRGVEAPAVRVVEGWMQSPGHRRNMLDPIVSRAGVGAAHDGGGGVYVTLVVFAPRGGP
jgi:uncharacterized protein YkwD